MKSESGTPSRGKRWTLEWSSDWEAGYNSLLINTKYRVEFAHLDNRCMNKWDLTIKQKQQKSLCRQTNNF